jgi:hypothetical protein
MRRNHLPFSICGGTGYFAVKHKEHLIIYNTFEEEQFTHEGTPIIHISETVHLAVSVHISIGCTHYTK